MTNKRFNIFGTKYNLVYSDHIDVEDKDRFVWGDTDSRIHKIRIATKDINDKEICRDEREITELHEIFHAILSEGQYSSCNQDEPLVEWLARCVHSLKKQGII